MKVKTLDAENKPTSQKLKMSVMLQNTVGGRVGETEVAKYDLTTDAKDGKATQTIKLEKGGSYAIRVEGIDRFDNPVIGQYGVTISDDKDNIRLRVLANQHSFEVGQTAKVQIHWREEPAAALVTYQGSTILDYKLLELKKGENNLEIPLDPKLSPNFDLAVAVMVDKKIDGDKQGSSLVFANNRIAVEAERTKRVSRFYQAMNSFEVQRKLNVSVEMRRKDAGNKNGKDKAEIRPGDEVEFVIKTTDATGKPVAAQLSVAMVEQSLLSMFSGGSGAIHEVFAGSWRTSAMRTGSSIDFYYQASARPIDKALLAESERIELEAEENKLREAGLPFGTTSPTLFAFDSPDTSEMNTEHFEIGSPALDVEPQAADLDGNINGLPQSQSGFGGRAAGRRAAVQGGQNVGELGQVASQNGPVSQFGFARNSLSGDEKKSAQSAGNAMIFNRASPVETFTFVGSNTSSISSLDQKANANNDWAALTQNRSRSNLPARATIPANGMVDGSVQDLGEYSGLISEIQSNVNPNTWNESLGTSGSNRALEATALNVYMCATSGCRDACMVNTFNGEQRNLNFRNELGLDFTLAGVEKLSRKLAASGNLLISQSGPQETGYWNPIVETDADGKTILTITVPEQSTAWKIITRGITADTLAGETSNELVVKRDLFGELKLPMAFVDGDEVEITALVHNSAIEKGKIEVVLRTILGDKKVEEKKIIEVISKGIHEVTFKVAIHHPVTNEKVAKGAREKRDENADTKNEKSGSMDPLVNVLSAFELTLTEVIADNNPKLREPQADLLRRVVPVLPYGVPVYATAGGTAGGDTSDTIEAPKGLSLQNPHLQIVLGPICESRVDGYSERSAG